jgi:hypothetical protein
MVKASIKYHLILFALFYHLSVFSQFHLLK